MDTQSTINMVRLLDKGEFEKVDQMLLGGANVDNGNIKHWEMTDYGGDGYYADVPYYFLKEAFASRRLDVAEYLLSRGANFGLVQKEVFADIEKSSGDYVVHALKLIAKHQPNVFLNMDNAGNNILHFLSRRAKEPEVITYWPVFTRNSPYNVEFALTPEQISDLLPGKMINALMVNRKNETGDTPIHLAIKNGHF